MNTPLISPNKPANSSYGGLSNYFKLETAVVNNKNKNTFDLVSLTGLLNEMPTIGFSVQYDDGPGFKISDTINKFMCNPLMDFANSIGAVDSSSYKKIIPTGHTTRKYYNGVDQSGITLNFKIYNTYIPKINSKSITSAATWIKNLSQYATPSSQNNLNINTLLNNIHAAAVNFNAAGEELTKFQMKSSDNAENGENANNSQADREKVYTANSKKLLDLNQSLNQLNSTLSTLLLNYTGEAEWLPSNFKFVSDSQSYNTGVTTSVIFLRITCQKTNGSIKTYCIDPNGYLHSSTALVTAGQFNTPHACRGIINESAPNIPDNLFNDVNNNIIKTALNKLEIDLSGLQTDTFDAALQAVINDFNGNNGLNDVDSLLTDDKIKAISEVGNKLIKRYDSNRVTKPFNYNNTFGIRLWRLNIFNSWLFQSGLPVYIENWSYTKSEEYQGYYDFTIECKFDQVYSKETWESYFLK